jgi:hypothetical protein
MKIFDSKMRVKMSVTDRKMGDLDGKHADK